MLYVIVKDNMKKGIKNICKYMFEKPLRIYTIKTPKFSYKLIKTKSDKINLYAVMELIGNLSHQIILQENLKLSKNQEVKLPSQDKIKINFMYTYLLQAFEQIKQNEIYGKISKKNIVFFDIDGEHIVFLDSILKYFGNVIVVTENFKKYEKYAKNTLEDYGAVLIVTNYLHNINDILFIISPKNDNILKYSKINLSEDSFAKIIYISSAYTKVAFKHCFCEFDATIADDVKKFIPYNIDEKIFMQAMVNENGYNDVDFENFTVNYNGVKTDNFSDKLMALINDNTNNG